MAAAISGRHSDGPPSQLLWHDRMSTADGRYVQLLVPIVGRHDADLARRLTLCLEHLWADHPTACGATIETVSVAIGRRGGQTTLILFLTLDRPPADRRIDDSRMARQLRLALAASADGGDCSDGLEVSWAAPRR